MAIASAQRLLFFGTCLAALLGPASGGRRESSSAIVAAERSLGSARRTATNVAAGRQGARAQAPRKKQRKKLPKAPSGEAAWEAVLRRYCSELLVHEFESLPPDARSSMLKAVQVVVEQTVQEASLHRQMSRLEMAGARNEPLTARRRPDDVDRSCPILQALSKSHKGIESIPGCLDHVIHRVLPQWGIAKGNEYQVMRHEYGLTQNRMAHSKELESGMVRMHGSISSVVKPAGSGKGGYNWAKLKPIDVRQLVMFQVAKKAVLSGTLVADPIISVGITTLLQDAEGYIIQLGLYNQLPGGATGDVAIALAEKVFAKGTKLSIAEPYAKIFRDGNRGVRVDDPEDVHIDSAQASDLAQAREDGNEFFQNKEFFVATDTYWRGLRSGGADVALLLSNRAQALLKQELWADALLDAAAAILLQPNEEKAWLRYTAALQGLGFEGLAARARHVRGGSEAPAPAIESAQAALVAALDRLLLRDDSDVEELGATSSEAELKEKADDAYGAGRFDEAAQLYTLAIKGSVEAEHAAAILCNIAVSALNTETLHDAAAAAAASLRLRVSSVKTVYSFARAIALLGLYDGADRFMHGAAGALSEDLVKDLPIYTKPLLKDISFAIKAFASTPMHAAALSSLDRNKIVSEWFAEDAIEMKSMSKKGRGIVAKRDIEQHEVLLVQRPRSKCACSETEELLQSIDHSKRTVDDTSQVKMKAQLTAAAHSDALLASTLSLLSDGGDDTPPVVPVGALLNRLSASVLPLLLQHPDFLPAAERVDLGSQRISGIVSTNCLTNKREKVRPKGLGDEAMAEAMASAKQLNLWQEGPRAALFPAIALINHASRPSCELRGLGELQAVVAAKRIRAGEELTLMYHSIRS